MPEKDPPVLLDYDQAALDAAYDQAAYTPNREQLIKRRNRDSELARRETSTLIIGLIGVISFAFSIGWDSYHGQGREEERHGTATGRQQAGSCEIPQTEPKKQDRRGHVSGA